MKLNPLSMKGFCGLIFNEKQNEKKKNVHMTCVTYKCAEIFT